VRNRTESHLIIQNSSDTGGEIIYSTLIGFRMIRDQLSVPTWDS